MEKPSGVPSNTRLLFFSGLKSSTFHVWIPSENQEKAATPCNGGSTKELENFLPFPVSYTKFTVPPVVSGNKLIIS